MHVLTWKDKRLDSTQFARDLDEVCDRFEASWRAGGRPLIEDFLGGTIGPDRLVLFGHLLHLELDYRGGLGECFAPLEYRRRFPGHEAQIESVFVEIARQPRRIRGGAPNTLVRTGWDGSTSSSAESPSPESFPNIPGVEILSELGRGGMGIVYKARQIRLNRLCALKVILPGKQNGAGLRARFMAEAETIARLSHPNIVKIYGLGDHDGRPYFEMEYIEGGSLARRLEGTPWPPGRAATTVAVLARAIGAAHRQGIVHRDLKPANVLLGDGDTPKVVDFGLAKWLEADSSLTQSGVFVVTPSYAAPEQVEGLTRTVGPAADIYALGALFYHTLTGRPPFQAATVHETLEQVKTADPVPPSRLQPGLSQDAETICLKCLQKDPQRRYADATALAEDLDRFLAGCPILARPVGAAERLRKWVWRRPAVALLSAAVMAVTVLGFILVSWQWQRAEAKAASAAAANVRAQQARRDAFENQAQLTFHQAVALCDQGEVGRGLLWLARSLELATEARSAGLDRPIRINLADWASQLSRLRRIPLMRHSGPILGLAFCSRGRALVSVGKDGVARIWDATAGNELEPSLDLQGVSRDAGLERLWFDSGGNGLLEAVDREGRTAFWDLNRRRPLVSLAECPNWPNIRDILFPEPQSPITRDDDDMVGSWEATTRRPPGAGTPSEQPRQGNTKWALSSDGRTLVVGGPDRRVVRWDVATRRPLAPELHLDTPAEAIAVTPDGPKVVTGRQAGRLQIWDADTERALELPRQGTAVTTLTVSPDGRVVASGTEGGVVRLWDTSLLGPFGQTCKLAGAVTALAFDPDGRVLAIGGDDGAIRLCGVPHQKAVGLPFRVNHPVQTVTFGEDSRRLLIGTTEGVRWWDVNGPMVRESDQG